MLLFVIWYPVLRQQYFMCCRRCRTHQLKPFFPWIMFSHLFLNFYFLLFLNWSMKLWISVSVLPMFYEGGKMMHLRGLKIACLKYFQLCPGIQNMSYCLRLDLFTLVWFVFTGLVCMKSSTSVVELVMLLCSQVRFYVSSSSHHLSLPLSLHSVSIQMQTPLYWLMHFTLALWFRVSPHVKQPVNNHHQSDPC